MHTFKDSKGRPWEIELNALFALLGDPVALTDLVFILCQEQAEKREISRDDLLLNMAGDALDDAANAFLESLADFCPTAKGRENLRKLTQTMKEVGTLMHERAGTELASLDPAIIVEKLMTLSGSAPASSASTPAPSLSAP